MTLGQQFPHETIGGSRFVRDRPTPRASHVLEGVEQYLRTALVSAPELRVTRNAVLSINEDTNVVPDIAVQRCRTDDVCMVIDLRHDSSDRYALGPKRLAYGAAAVDEYWLIDIGASIVWRLVFVPRLHAFRMPPERLVTSDVVSVTCLGDRPLEVERLLTHH